MLRALYDLQLQHMIRPGRVAVGEFTEGEMHLAAANMANKVVISKLPSFSTYASRIVPTKESLQILNINQTITSLAVGRFTPEASTDLLFVGTPTELIVYDVARNREVLRKATTGGASSIVIGKTGRVKKTLAIVGGQSALQGFDEDGNEPLWTLTGDNVAVLTLFDINKDAQVEIIAGCDDHQIRIFRETEQIFSMTETDKVISLASLKEQSFVYGLANGTVGVYEQYDRKWRVKSKSKPLTLLGFDMNGDGEPEILCGWSSGKFEVRDRFNGNLLFKYQMDDPIAQILEVNDPANRSEKYILVASAEGDVKAFAVEDGTSKEYTVTFLQDIVSETPGVHDHENGEPTKPKDIPEPAKVQVRKDDSVHIDPSFEWSVMPSDVEITIEIEPVMKRFDYFTKPINDNQKDVIIPPEILSFLRTDEFSSTAMTRDLPDLFDKPCLKFNIRTNSDDYRIPGVVIFSEGVFSGESYYHRVPERFITSSTEFPVIIPKNLPVEMFVTVMAGQANRKFYFCHGELIRIKRFAMYYDLSGSDKSAQGQPEGFVTFKIQERLNRFLLWASENFFLRTIPKPGSDQTGCVLSFLCLRDGKPLSLKMTSEGEITIMTDCLDTAGDVVESMSEGMTIRTLSSRAHFPKAFGALANVFTQIDEFQKNRQRQAADIADRGASIRAILMKAEEVRLLETWPDVKTYFMELRNLNKSVLGDFKVQLDAQEKFTNGLKLISQTIDKAARLRVGPPKSELFTRCRGAVQNRDVQLLIKLMQFGAS